MRGDPLRDTERNRPDELSLSNIAVRKPMGARLGAVFDGAVVPWVWKIAS